MSDLLSSSPPLLGMWPCKLKLDEKQSTVCRLGSGKLFFCYIFAQFAEAGEMRLLEKSVINMIWLLLHVFECPIIIIGTGGLLLVVPTYFQSPFQFYGWGWRKSKQLNLDVTYFRRVTYWHPHWDALTSPNRIHNNHLPSLPTYLWYLLPTYLGSHLNNVKKKQEREITG
jgi:hypothetical protein